MAQKDHTCIKSEEIAVLTDRVYKLQKTIDGTGELGTGLKDVVIALNNTVHSFQNTVHGLSTSVSGILKFQTETEMAIRMKAKYRANQHWLIGISITLLLGAVGLIIQIITKP